MSFPSHGLSAKHPLSSQFVQIRNQTEPEQSWLKPLFFTSCSGSKRDVSVPPNFILQAVRITSRLPHGWACFFSVALRFYVLGRTLNSSAREPPEELRGDRLHFPPCGVHTDGNPSPAGTGKQTKQESFIN
ncbi:hypothetical protein ILYODFUR_035749 [Ilyodon furcidens]|uniref:Uncharacterized protein n=1 Tax=Ilyodon furcidens TaxID=33524 RepID=A0ABV0UYZ6_9TELE